MRWPDVLLVFVFAVVLSRRRLLVVGTSMLSHFILLHSERCLSLFAYLQYHTLYDRNACINA